MSKPLTSLFNFASIRKESWGRWIMDLKTGSGAGHTNPVFYWLDNTGASRYYWAQVINRGAPDRWWPRDFVDFEGRMSIAIQTGKTAADFIWNGHLLPSVSSRVVGILREASIIGFTTYRVRIEHEGTEIYGYHGLAIRGKGGPNHPSAYAAGLVKGTSIQKVDGLRPAEWDGSDLFTLDDVPGASLPPRWYLPTPTPGGRGYLEILKS